MNAPENQHPDDPPLVEVDPDAVYTLEVVARLTGASSETILLYRERGLIASVPTSDSAVPSLDTDAVRNVRRLEHLRTEWELSEPALTLTLKLLAEIEQLRNELRSRR